MNTRQIGQKGEEIGCKFLERQGFQICDRNYYRKWGELDIVAKKDRIIHFFEVKSIETVFSVSNFDSLQGTSTYKPEDNVHGLKQRHLRRIIETYLYDKGGGEHLDFQFHVLCVYLNMKTHRARVQWIKNVIL